MNGTDDFESIAADARKRLIDELHRTVDTFGTAVDEAAGTMLDAAEGEAKRRADEAANSAERLAGAGLEPLRRLSSELLDRAQELDREVRRLSELASDAASAMRRQQVTASRRFEPPPPTRQSPLDVIDSVRDSIVETPLDLPKWGRFRPEPEPVEPEPSEAMVGAGRSEPAATAPDAPVDPSSASIPEGVRVMVEQLRIAGRSDAVIADHLREVGIEDPLDVVARVRNP